MSDRKVKNGDLVKDTVSGFTGIVVCIHVYLNGCNRMSVQPKVDKDGKLPESASFDEPQLKLVKKEKVKGDDGKTGGPEKYMPSARPE